MTSKFLRYVAAFLSSNHLTKYIKNTEDIVISNHRPKHKLPKNSQNAKCQIIKSKFD